MGPSIAPSGIETEGTMIKMIDLDKPSIAPSGIETNN